VAWFRRRESLLPIRLCGIGEIEAWSAAQPGRPDLAKELPIQDFVDWTNAPAFAHALSMLLQGLGGK
jgi:hypothetical protein